MRKALFLSLLLLFSNILLCYELTLVSEGESNYLAKNWVHYINKMPLSGKSGDYQIRSIEQITYKQNPLCVVYHLDPQGHILVPLYKEFLPIKSFSVVSDFDPDSMGYEFVVLKELRNGFDYLVSYDLGESLKLDKILKTNSKQWNKFIKIEIATASLEEKFNLIPENRSSDQRKFLMTDELGKKLETTSASPLLNTKWHQGAPYWNWCPLLGGNRCYVGCTATAMAQIMRYHKWPDRGVGSYSYYWPNGNKNLSADFSDPYDWGSMANLSIKASSGNEAVAELCYEAGVSVDMNYGTEGSSAYVWKVDDALRNYFKYSNEARVVYRKDYSNVDEWFNVLKGQRDLSRPLEFAMYGTDIAHAVVIDGYLISGGLNQVHINMGWGGSYDGYYTLDNILNFTDTYWQHAVINIIPDRGVPKEGHIELDQNSLTFTGSVGESNPPSQTFSIRNSGKGNMNYQITDDSNWLSVNPNSGGSLGEWNQITVSVNTSGLGHGNYTGTISISSNEADNSPQNLMVYLTMVEDRPPTVTITSPQNGAVVSGTVLVKADASDDKGVTKVDFYLDNIYKHTDYSAPYEWSWNSNTASIGYHTIRARAYDTKNQTAEDSIQVEIRDRPPEVSITSPNDGATVSKKVTIRANATDDKGVTKVEFYIDNKYIGADYSSPYNINWDTTKYSSGNHTVKAKAYDTINQTAADSIQVKVDQPPEVIISSPQDEANVSGIVTIKANANDDFGIKKVQFYINGVLEKTDKKLPHEYSWNTTQIFNGSYRVKVIVYDTINQTDKDLIKVELIPHAPLDFSGEKVENRALLQREFINVLKWNSNPYNRNIANYRIYKLAGAERSLVAEVAVDTFEYWHRNVNKDEQYQYALVAVDNQGREGDQALLNVQ